MNQVILASTLHDPKGVFLGYLDQATTVIMQNYRGWVVSVTKDTDQRIKDKLTALGATVTEADPAKPIVLDGIENNHLSALTVALAEAKKSEADCIQYTDGDRMIMAAVYFAAELKLMSTRAGEIGASKSYLNFRRSAEDYLTHHPPLVETELEFNRLYTGVFGMKLDIGSTSHVMSTDVAEEILRRSPDMEVVTYPHCKWLVIAKEMGAQISSLETHDVLTFETPLQVRPRSEDYALMQQEYMAEEGLTSTLDPKERMARFTLQEQYITLLLNHVDRIVDPHRVGELTQELRRSLLTNQRRRDMEVGVLEANLTKESGRGGDAGYGADTRPRAGGFLDRGEVKL